MQVCTMTFLFLQVIQPNFRSIQMQNQTTGNGMNANVIYQFKELSYLDRVIKLRL